MRDNVHLGEHGSPVKFGAYSLNDALVPHFTLHCVAERAFQHTELERRANSLVLIVVPVPEKLPTGGHARGGDLLELCYTLVSRLIRSSSTLRLVRRLIQLVGLRPLVRGFRWQLQGRREIVVIRVESEPQIIT